MKHDPHDFAAVMPMIWPMAEPTGPARSKIDGNWALAMDSLTGLAARARFEERLQARLHAGHARLALLLIDVDYFKQINDGHGHPTGDQILRRLADRMRAGIRRGDLAARLGGDEFAVILEGLADVPAFVARAQALVNRLCQPMKLDGHRLPCSVSAGLAIAEDGSTGLIALMKNADAALYDAKSAGGGQLSVFDADMRAELAQKTEAEARAREAIKNHRIVPFYQPKVDLQTGDIVGFEALMRWKAPDGTVESPGGCPRVLEDPHIARIAIDVMLSRVLADLKKWQEEGVARPVSINLTDSDLRRAGFAEWFLGRISRVGIPTRLIAVEISETVPLARNPAQITRVLHELSEAGIRIALDDFGTGNASLVHLRTLPVDELKIDRQFVAGLETEPDDRAIVASMLALASTLSIEVVAEGIETWRQQDILRSEGCRIGQGYLLGRPKPARSILRLLRRALAGRDPPSLQPTA